MVLEYLEPSVGKMITVDAFKNSTKRENMVRSFSRILLTVGLE